HDEQLAIELLQTAIALDPRFADAYEALGVIYGRHERFEEAISLMKQLAEIDPASIMAHTNMSLYLMRLGRIEEAEEAKSNATVKTFENLGKQARAKEEWQEAQQKKQAELKRRESMFLEVLELDPDDIFALFGLAEIEFTKKNFLQAEK